MKYNVRHPPNKFINNKVPQMSWKIDFILCISYIISFLILLIHKIWIFVSPVQYRRKKKNLATVSHDSFENALGNVVFFSISTLNKRALPIKNGGKKIEGKRECL